MISLSEYISESILDKRNKVRTVDPIYYFREKLGEVVDIMKSKKKVDFGDACLEILKPYYKHVTLPTPYPNKNIKVYGEYKYGKPVAFVYSTEVGTEIILLGPDKKTLDKPVGSFRPGPMRRTQVLKLGTYTPSFGDFAAEPNVSSKALWWWIDHEENLTMAGRRQVWEIDPKVAKQFIEALGDYVDTLSGEFFTDTSHKWQREMDELKEWFI